MSNEQKTHWKMLMNPDYVGAYWLPPGEDVTVVIDYVVREMITGTGGKKEECTVAHLKGGVKPFILNATNSKSIAKLYGPYIEDWAGMPITLFASTAKLAGDTVECLRIRPIVPKREPKTLKPARFEAALESIKAGTYTVKQLESYALTMEQETMLEALCEEMAAAKPAAETEPTDA